MKSKYSGYMGKIMEVDLTTETVREYPWSDAQRELLTRAKKWKMGLKHQSAANEKSWNFPNALG